jgi:hypothetical protein
MTGIWFISWMDRYLGLLGFFCVARPFLNTCSFVISSNCTEPVAGTVVKSYFMPSLQAQERLPAVQVPGAGRIVPY